MVHCDLLFNNEWHGLITSCVWHMPHHPLVQWSIISRFIHWTLLTIRTVVWKLPTPFPWNHCCCVFVSNPFGWPEMGCVPFKCVSKLTLYQKHIFVFVFFQGCWYRGVGNSYKGRYKSRWSVTDRAGLAGKVRTDSGEKHPPQTNACEGGAGWTNRCFRTEKGEWEMPVSLWWSNELLPMLIRVKVPNPLFKKTKPCLFQVQFLFHITHGAVVLSCYIFKATSGDYQLLECVFSLFCGRNRQPLSISWLYGLPNSSRLNAIFRKTKCIDARTCTGTRAIQLPLVQSTKF